MRDFPGVNLLRVSGVVLLVAFGGYLFVEGAENAALVLAISALLGAAVGVYKRGWNGPYALLIASMLLMALVFALLLVGGIDLNP